MANPIKQASKNLCDTEPSGLYEQTACQQTTLVDELKAERARVTKRMTTRIRELDLAIRTLESSDAEALVQDARRVLYKEE